MQAVFLYGPPGVGKLTVGKELARLTGFKLVHNHLTVNLASSLFPFQSDPWLRLLRQVRRDVFAAASSEGVDLIVTGVYRGTVEVTDAWRTMLEPIPDSGGSVMWVRLTCQIPELLRRVQTESRRAYEKLTDPQVLADQLAQEDLFPSVPFEPRMDLDTTVASAATVASEIAAHFSLPCGEG
jgi:shikimate kinase